MPLGDFVQALSNTRPGDGVTIPNAVLTALVRAVGGSIVLTAEDLAGRPEEHLEIYQQQYPWRQVTFRITETPP